MTPPPEPGEVIGGKYRVVRLRGEGGNGSVYEAQNVLTEKRVAIKWLRTTQSSYHGVRERMLREAQSAARVRHRNVVDVYDVGFDDGVVYLVMELLEGETLAALLSRRELPIWELIALLIPALRGVAAAHRSGVIHRDLKPENLFLATDPEHAEPRCVVLDFGVAKLSGSAALTTPGYAVGTPIFMPIEQLMSGATVDERSDVHAVAVILYVALTGCSPYEGETLRDMAMQMLTVEPVPVHQLRPDVPFELCLTIKRAMSKERSDRPASIDELIADLTPFMSADGAGWGRARNLHTHVVPGDLGTPGSHAVANVASHRARSDAGGVVSTRKVASVSAPPSSSAESVIPRAPFDSRWLLVVAVVTALAIVVIDWPERAPPVAAPAVVARAVEARGLSAGEQSRDAAVFVPMVLPESEPPQLPDAAVEVVTRPRPLRMKRPRAVAREPVPTKNVRELSVDEFAFEE